MPGIFGDLFDFDGDGKLNTVEQAEELLALERACNEDDTKSDIFEDEDDFGADLFESDDFDDD